MKNKTIFTRFQFFLFLGLYFCVWGYSICRLSFTCLNRLNLTRKYRSFLILLTHKKKKKDCSNYLPSLPDYYLGVLLIKEKLRLRFYFCFHFLVLQYLLAHPKGKAQPTIEYLVLEQFLWLVRGFLHPFYRR